MQTVQVEEILILYFTDLSLFSSNLKNPCSYLWYPLPVKVALSRLFTMVCWREIKPINYAIKSVWWYIDGIQINLTKTRTSSTKKSTKEQRISLYKIHNMVCSYLPSYPYVVLWWKNSSVLHRALTPIPLVCTGTASRASSRMSVPDLTKSLKAE